MRDSCRRARANRTMPPPTIGEHQRPLVARLVDAAELRKEPLLRLLLLDVRLPAAAAVVETGVVGQARLGGGAALCAVGLERLQVGGARVEVGEPRLGQQVRVGRDRGAVRVGVLARPGGGGDLGGASLGGRRGSVGTSNLTYCLVFPLCVCSWRCALAIVAPPGRNARTPVGSAPATRNRSSTPAPVCEHRQAHFC